MRICEYGCGQEAKYYLEFKSGNKWCCSKYFQSCPINKNEPWNKGKTNVYSKDALEKMQKAKVGKILSEEHKQNLSKVRKGKKKNEKHKMKISLALKGKKKSKEHCEKLSTSQKGKPRKKHTKETREIQSKNQIGILNTFYGKTHSKESRKKIARPGESNPNWKGGISCEPYCSVWSDKEYKESIKERDGYKCINPVCEKKTLKLCLHHINYNKKDCSPKNIATTCKSCNSIANFDREWHESWYKAILHLRYNL